MVLLETVDREAAPVLADDQPLHIGDDLLLFEAEMVLQLDLITPEEIPDHILLPL